MHFKRTLFFLFGFATATAAASGPPPEFEIMSKEIPAGIPRPPVNDEQGFFLHSKPDASEEKYGWMAGRIGTECTGIPENKYESPFRDRRLDHFAAGGQYVTMAFVIQVLKDQKKWNLVLNELSNSTGEKIPTDHIQLRRIISKRTFQTYSQDMLVSPELENVRKGDILHYLYLVSVPRGAAPGIYRGSIRISDDAATAEIPVSLRVFGYDLPKAEGVFGTYLAGHFGTKGTGYKRYSPENFSPEQLDILFRFWKTRGLNSPTLTHLLPEYENVNGKKQISFKTVRLFADAMNRARLEGPLCIDPRFWAWHAEGLEKTTPDKSAEEHFKERIKALIQTAEQEKWPALKIFPEEEVGNPDNTKKRTYARFRKPLREVAGGRDYIIDNDIGYNRSDAVDRGNTDNFPVIQYNSWEDKALDTAHKNHREVWAYNYGFHRGSFGFLLARLGATGNHQWAEMWITDTKHYWQTLAFLQDGVCSGMNYEWMQEGISDYRYLQLLREKIARLRHAGKDSEAQKLEKIIRQVSADIPITSAEAGGWNATATESELNRRRWQIALAIQEANQLLNGKTEEKASSPQSELKLEIITAPAKAEQFQTADSSIALPILKNPKLDGMPNLRGKNTTGALRVRVSDEVNARAYSSSLEEFQKRIACAWTAVWLTYSQEGLLISSIGNFGTPSPQAKPKYEDGDGNLWREICMEYFFQKPGDKGFYQLIVSNFDKKVMLYNGKASFQGIRVISRPDVNPAGGLAQEVLIPWSAFGLERMPETGTVWKFNACRELHGYSNPLMSWGRVMTGFAESDRWGTLIFTGKSDTSAFFDKVIFDPLYPGKNTVSGTLKPLKQTAILMLTDAKGTVVCKKTIPAGKSEHFIFDFDIPDKVPPQAWQLKLADGTGKELEQFLLPLEPGRSLSTGTGHQVVVSGEPLPFRAMVRISNASVRNFPLEVTARSGKNSMTYPPAVFLRGGDNHIWLTTQGMKPGKYEFEFRLKNGSEKIALEILPPFAEPE